MTCCAAWTTASASPALAGIVLAGHSGGAQLVQRYAVLNNVDGPLRRDGLALRYVIANPSSYLYLTNERPRPDGKGYAPYERGICPTYNQYKYGTDKLPAYARGQEESRLFVRYAARDVTYLLGGADNNPEHRLLDKTCGAEAQGSTRLARGTAYLQYEFLLASRGGKPVTLHRAGYEVRGVGHDGKNMFGSECGAQALLGEGARGTDKAAPCEPIAAASSARQAPSRAPSNHDSKLNDGAAARAISRGRSNIGTCWRRRACGRAGVSHSGKQQGPP